MEKKKRIKNKRHSSNLPKFPIPRHLKGTKWDFQFSSISNFGVQESPSPSDPHPQFHPWVIPNLGTRESNIPRQLLHGIGTLEKLHPEGIFRNDGTSVTALWMRGGARNPLECCGNGMWHSHLLLFPVFPQAMPEVFAGIWDLNSILKLLSQPQIQGSCGTHLSNQDSSWECCTL